MKISKNKLARELSYKTIMGVLPILEKYSISTGISDVHELIDYITSLSMDDFLDYKFTDNLIEGD